MARALTSAGVAHVVAVDAHERVLDAVCHVFANHFYPAIFKGQDVQSAFEAARQAVNENDRIRLLFNENLAEDATLEAALKLRLYPEDSLEHQNNLSIEGDPGDSFPLEESHTNLPRRNIPFLGQQFAIHDVLKMLQTAPRQKSVGIHGMGGMGKTSLAIALGRWYHTRNSWADGVWYCDLRLTTNNDEACAKICNILRIESCRPDRLARLMDGRTSLVILDDLD